MNPNTIARFLFVCNTRTCNQLYATDIDQATWNGKNPKCPKCDERLETVENPATYNVCVSVDCSQFLSSAANQTDGRCEGKRGDKHGLCNFHLIEMDDDDVLELPDMLFVEEEDKGPDGPSRRLKAAMARATRWVHGSGSHHPSKGGPHTAAAREMHSAASGSKARVRESMIAELDELIEAVQATNKPDQALIKEAQKVKQMVRNK